MPHEYSAFKRTLERFEAKEETSGLEVSEQKQPEETKSAFETDIVASLLQEMVALEIDKHLENFVKSAVDALVDPEKSVFQMRALSGRCLSKAVVLLRKLKGPESSMAVQRLFLDNTKVVLLKATDELD